MNAGRPAHIKKFINLLRCPACGHPVEQTAGSLQCAGGGHVFPFEQGIPRMFIPNDRRPGEKDITETVKAFYEKTPFPDYDDFDSVAQLIKKSRSGLFSRLLDEQIPLGSSVLEVGCGTGQLSNFLGIADRAVFGTDICLNSLALAENFRKKNHLERIGFYQMNLFRPIFKPESFDLVISNGVLHHTSDPLGGFKSIAPLVKKGGYIMLGLYNKFGRLVTDLRRLIYRLAGKRFLFLDPYLKERRKIDSKTEAWFTDQYRHPHESKHTMMEILQWFDGNGFQFVNSIPKNRFMQPLTDDEKLFTPVPRAGRAGLAAVQAHMILTGNREGGLFIMIGRRI